MRRIGMALALAASPLIASCGETAEEAAPVEEVVDTRTPEERVESLLDNSYFTRRCTRAIDEAGNAIKAEEYTDRASLTPRENYFARQAFNKAKEGRIETAEAEARQSCYEDGFRREAGDDQELGEAMVQAYRESLQETSTTAEATPS